MSASAVRMGKAFVEIGTKLGPEFDRGLKEGGAKLKAFGAKVTQVGAGMVASSAAVLAPLTAAVTEFAKVGSQINKIATQTGNSVEEVSKITGAAAQLGIEIDDVVGSMEELNIRLGEAVREGTGPLADTFKALGIDAKEFAALPVTEQYQKLADVLSGIEDRAQRQFLADEIFGGDAFKILPLLEQGGAALADQLANVAAMTTEEAAAAAELSQAWNQLEAVTHRVVTAVGGALAPAVTTLLEMAIPLIDSVVKWIKNNQALVVTVAGVAAGVGALGIVLTTAGGIIAAVGVALSGLGTAIAFLLSPVGLTIAAIALVAAGLAGLIAWIVSASGLLDGLGSIFGETWNGIMGALLKGDLEAAGEIAMLGLQAIWARIWSNIELLAFSALESIIGAIMQIPGIELVVGVDDEAMDKALEATRKSIEKQATDAEKALQIAVDKANTSIEQDEPQRKASLTGGSDPVVEAMQEAAEAQKEAAEIQKAAAEKLGEDLDTYVPGGGDELANEIGIRGATNTAAAALLVSGGKSAEVVLLEKQFAELKAQTNEIKKHSALFQMMERDGGGIAVTAGT